MAICSKCGIVAETERKLKLHMACHDERSFNCDICHIEVFGLKSLKNHKSSHESKRCDSCFESFAKKNYSRHVQTCKGEREQKFQCEKCPYITGYEANLKKHVNTQVKTEEKIPFKCLPVKKNSV